MLVTYLRSSSYTGYTFCQQQYFLSYTLGLRPDETNKWSVPGSQKKADKGTLVHKALELLARGKLAEQEGALGFTDEETGRHFPRTPCVEEAVAAAWAHYTQSLSHWEWTDRDHVDCLLWAQEALTAAGGRVSPLTRTVLWPEKRFDLTFEADWARYDYALPDGTRLAGRLALKGTLDLVCRTEHGDCVELIDWKTGARKDWATGKPKDFKSLMNDAQLRLYHYALCRLCPWAKEVFITIVYLRDGGAFSLPFSRKMLPETEALIKERFAAIRDNARPELLSDQPAERWKCERLCAFGQNDWPGSQKTACQFIADEVVQLGVDRVTLKYGRAAALTQYGTGGGRSEGGEG